MIKHNKKMKGALKHFRKTGDTDPMIRVLAEQSIKSIKLKDKLETVL